MPGGRPLTYGVRALIAAAIVSPFWFWKGGVLELEVLQFIRQYLDGRSVLQKVFDPYRNDFGTYQARELSYFIDYIDAHVFERLMRLHVTSFIPLSAVVASILAVSVFFFAARRYKHVPALTASLLLLMYVANYTHLVTMGMFYRSTKPLLAGVLMATVFYIASLLDDSPGLPPSRKASADHRSISDGGKARGSIVTIFGLFCLMSLLDRQGFFYAIVGTVVLAGHAFLARRDWKPAAAGAAAVVVMFVEDVWLGPLIVEAVNHYVPTLSYQQVSREPLLHLTPYRQSIELLTEAVNLLVGSTSTWIACGLLALVCAAGVWRSGETLTTRARAGGAVLVVLGSQVVMFAAMIVRHPPLYEWLDHRYWYYTLPAQALIVALVIILLNRAVAGWASWKMTVVNVVLVLAILGNVAHWTFYRDRMLTSRWFSRVYPQTEILKSSIASGQPDPRLIRQYREFFDLCMSLRGTGRE
jgi:hypothetical protein